MFSKLAMTALCCGAMVAGASAQMSGMSKCDHSMAMGSTPMATDAAGKSFDSGVSVYEDEIVSAAKAMPANKFEFAPSQEIFKGSQKTEFATVRTFGSQLRHIASANYYFFGSREMKPDVDPQSIEKISGKDATIAALKKSFAYAHMQTSTMTAANAFDAMDLEGHPSTRAAKYAFGMAHMSDHYGQLVEYLRMNGIVPPASRK